MIIGISNGSLYEQTIRLFAKLGIYIQKNGRSFDVRIQGTNLFQKAYIMRPQDMPMVIMSGKIDCGICGWDCVIESGLENKLEKIASLNYSKKSNKSARVVIFGKTKELVDEKNITVTSEYPNLSKRLFKKARIDFSYGSTEAKVIAGIYDYGVGIVETGESLRDNNLKIVKVISESPVVLMTKEKSTELMGFGKILEGALRAEDYQLVTLNVDKEKVDEVVRLLPALKSPTLCQLKDGSFSISTVVNKNVLVDLVIKIRQKGAENILISDINAVI